MMGASTAIAAPSSYTYEQLLNSTSERHSALTIDTSGFSTFTPTIGLLYELNHNGTYAYYVGSCPVVSNKCAFDFIGSNTRYFAALSTGYGKEAYVNSSVKFTNATNSNAITSAQASTIPLISVSEAKHVTYTFSNAKSTTSNAGILNYDVTRPHGVTLKGGHVYPLRQVLRYGDLVFDVPGLPEADLFIGANPNIAYGWVSQGTGVAAVTSAGKPAPNNIYNLDSIKASDVTLYTISSSSLVRSEKITLLARQNGTANLVIATNITNQNFIDQMDVQVHQIDSLSLRSRVFPQKISWQSGTLRIEGVPLQRFQRYAVSFSSDASGIQVLTKNGLASKYDFGIVEYSDALTLTSEETFSAAVNFALKTNARVNVEAFAPSGYYVTGGVFQRYASGSWSYSHGGSDGDNYKVVITNFDSTYVPYAYATEESLGIRLFALPSGIVDISGRGVLDYDLITEIGPREK